MNGRRNPSLARIATAVATAALTAGIVAAAGGAGVLGSLTASTSWQSPGPQSTSWQGTSPDSTSWQ
jgi:hypothetical protein